MQVQRFSFKTFDEKGPVVATAKKFLPTGRSREEAPPSPPPPPTYNEEQLKAAERDGYKKGFLEGIEDGKKQAETEQAATNRQLVAMAEQFTRSIALLLDDYRQLSLLVKGELPKVAMTIAQKVAGPAIDEQAQKIVDDLAARCLEHLSAAPKITITVPEKLAATLENTLKDLADRLPAAAHTAVVKSSELQGSDCKIAWDHGVMERDTQALWQQVEKIIGTMSAMAVRDAETQITAVEAAIDAQAKEQPEKKE